MAPMVFGWAFRKPVTTRYPFEPRKALDGSRGRLVFNQQTCVHCTICAKKCPTGALAVDRANKTWSIDRLRCISCGACVDACPKKSLELSTEHGVPTRTKDKETF
jgi:formate hydrogenlyase subunit 6/NADH:ubiquinone oxidoreductase subunit I